MGHTDSSMTGHYREIIQTKRLVGVTDHVRSWLFSDGDSTDKDDLSDDSTKIPATELEAHDVPSL